MVDIHFELNGTTFVWNAKKAAANPIKHDGITFEQAATVFFDPLFRLVDAGRNDEARNAVIGYDTQSRLLYVVHVEIEGEAIRIISARKATNEERKHHDP
ncbi:MAG: BrnT family toxin [Sulfurisoma sp.]|nr:BrnT family toxin [Sulfurisoma sp.]